MPLNKETKPTKPIVEIVEIDCHSDTSKNIIIEKIQGMK